MTLSTSSIKHALIRIFGYSTFHVVKQINYELFRHDKKAVHTVKVQPGEITVPVSVIVPTYNGGEDLRTLLKAIQGQQGIANLEIIVIDSGSTDETLAIAKEAGATIMKVTQKEFNHGATRTKAAKQAKGEYVIFIVQDAVPKENRLFAHMISFLQQNKDTAAVSVMQTPKADADVFAKWQTEFTYESLYFDTHDFILRKPEGTAFTHLPLLVRRQICFLDDVCCAVKKDVFFELGGFPRIPISEDTWFAKEAVNTGYGIGFIGSKSVTHSHTRPAEYFLKRSYIGFKTQLGLFEMPVETPFATFQELMDSFATVLKSEDLTELALVEQLKERLDVTSLQELDSDEIDNEFAMTISGMRLQTKKLSREDKKELYLKVYASLLGKHIAQYVLVHEDAEMEAICDELLAANV